MKHFVYKKADHNPQYYDITKYYVFSCEEMQIESWNYWYNLILPDRAMFVLGKGRFYWYMNTTSRSRDFEELARCPVCFSAVMGKEEWFTMETLYKMGGMVAVEEYMDVVRTDCELDESQDI